MLSGNETRFPTSLLALRVYHARAVFFDRVSPFVVRLSGETQIATLSRIRDARKTAQGKPRSDGSTAFRIQIEETIGDTIFARFFRRRHRRGGGTLRGQTGLLTLAFLAVERTSRTKKRYFTKREGQVVSHTGFSGISRRN